MSPRPRVPGTGEDTRPDLLDRDFVAEAPSRVWVAGITYCRTFAGRVYKGVHDLDIAVAEHIDWFNRRRLHGEIGLVPPVEFEDNYYGHNPAPATVDGLVQSLH